MPSASSKEANKHFTFSKAQSNYPHTHTHIFDHTHADQIGLKWNRHCIFGGLYKNVGGDDVLSGFVRENFVFDI